ncbi:MAG: molybdenum cofactor guanylyltransferase [Actinomycetota bacterium]
MEATGVILAGGKSRRMGRDKLGIPLCGTPLILRVHRALAPHCAEVVVAGSGGENCLPPGVRRVLDERPGFQGPLAGLEAALYSARHPRVFVAAGDMPFLPESLVGHLLGALEGGYLAAVPRYGGRLHPLCAAYDRATLPRVTTALDAGVRAMYSFLASLERVRYVERELERFGAPAVFLRSLNTPEDLCWAELVCREEG